MAKEVYTFYELINEYDIKIPILQRDYAQGREENLAVCENFLKTLKTGLIEKKNISLDFIYGNVENGTFFPLDGQQRLTTLFLLHWYAAEKESVADESREKLKRFSYETRSSSRRFCEALINGRVQISDGAASLREQIIDSEWFYLSWKFDPTIKAMLSTIDMIHEIYQNVENIWEALVDNKYIGFHLLILESFGLSDDLYIKMNARGRLLTPFENLKAEIENKIIQFNWEQKKKIEEKFENKIDNEWTDFLWQNYRKDNSIDDAHMNFITTLVMTKLPSRNVVKGERTDVVQKLNVDNSQRELIEYIDEDAFGYICGAYELYANLAQTKTIPLLQFPFWRHKPSDNNLLQQILVGSNTSYTHKVLFYAQTLYLMRVSSFSQNKFEEWMRVVRNIVSRADLNADGKRSDLVRSPEAFNGAIGLVDELANGCDDIYGYLSSASFTPQFAKEQIKEESLKAMIIQQHPEYKELLFELEDNELLRGRISLPLACAGYKTDIDEIDFELLEKIQVVFGKYFNKELDSNDELFDKIRRALLTIEIDGEYHCYNYWWSFWNAASAEKRKLFPTFREIEYYIYRNEYTVYFMELVIKLTQVDIDTLLKNFKKPDNMENWQYRLIVEEGLLAKCTSKYIAIAQDRSYCYLMRSKRPSDLGGSEKIE